MLFRSLTARSEREEIVAGMSAGADDFIAKPFDPAELLVRIRAGERILSLETRDLAIFALAKLAESRDSETGHHLERVQWYSRALTKRLAAHPKFQDQVDADFVRLIFLTSPVHDIGKVGIPDGVLRKPGRLTPEEVQVMRTHPQIGAETLDAALAKFPDARFLQIARDIITNAGTAPAIPPDCGAKRFRCAAASSRWPTCTTPSPAAAATRNRSSTIWRAN